MLRFLPLSVALLLSAPSLAQPPAPAELARCTAIADPAERLACFDALARPATPAPPAADPKPVREPVKEPAAASVPAPEPTGVAPAAPPRQAVAPAPVDLDERSSGIERFGAESLPPTAEQRATPASIESRLKGEFTGWVEDTVFELENGQAWQCRKCRSVYHRAESPRVTIRRSFTGVYWLKVDGLNQQAKVHRIR